MPLFPGTLPCTSHRQTSQAGMPLCLWAGNGLWPALSPVLPPCDGLMLRHSQHHRHWDGGRARLQLGDHSGTQALTLAPAPFLRAADLLARSLRHRLALVPWAAPLQPRDAMRLRCFHLMRAWVSSTAMLGSIVQTSGPSIIITLLSNASGQGMVRHLPLLDMTAMA